MATINFYLKDPKSSKKTPINLFLNYGASSPFKYATGFSVLPSDWNIDRQRVREKRSIPDCVECNAFLSKLQALASQVYFRVLTENNEVNRELLKAAMDKELNKDKKKTAKPLNFMQYLDYIVEFKERVNTSDVRIIKACVTKIKKYCQQTRKPLSFEDMTLTFRDQFNAYLEEEGLRQNSISTYFSALRIILIQAQEEGLNPHHHFRSKKFSARPEKVKHYALQESELIKIYEVDLSGLPKSFEEVRDTFLIGAFSLMRVSDYSTLNRAHFQDGKIYRKTQKTGANVVVPVHWIVQEILNKRNGELPRQMHRNVINARIKEIAELAGITNEVVVSSTRGGQRIHEIKSKFETVTTHTARRSGATNMIKQGIARSDVMTVGGWTTEDAFNRYIDIAEEDTATKLASHPFFKKA
ncbi:site-specific integrase [Dyadobacter sp. CY261]|uniref:site-specific integrase n=1 Tax=Dyadobacter sp. CY261 TaxID=2907203 RepID=UPI001F47EAD9|nr:site-specific integrase [Dyadobacter sp. CY261]MCF0074001.1 site-specific integrase [Dyadobacter sp. CY261]